MLGLRRAVPEPLPFLTAHVAPADCFEMVRRRFTCTLDDVVLSTIAGGLHQLALMRGEFPTPVATHTGRGVIALPAQLHRPAQRLRGIHTATSALAHGARSPRSFDLAVAPSLRAAPRRADFVIAHIHEDEAIRFSVYAPEARFPELRELPMALGAAVLELEHLSTARPRVAAA